MPPKFGNYLFRNLKGQSPEESQDPSSERPSAFGVLEEQIIVLRQEDIRVSDAGAPPLDWSKVERSEIAIQLKETQGIMDGCVTVKASTLQRICPALLPVQLEAEYLFPVSLRTVVLQVQAHLKQNLGEVLKPAGPDFDTPIAQVAREDEGFFKLEGVAQPAPTAAEKKSQTKSMATEPALTPADRPSFPLIRERPRTEDTKSAPPPLEVTVHPVVKKRDTPRTVSLQSNPFAGLPKVGAEPVKRVEGLAPVVTAPLSAPKQSERHEDHGRLDAGTGPSSRANTQKPLRRIGLERLQEIFMTEDLLDARQVAKLVAAFPKVKGILIMLGDGTLMSGDLPEGYHLESALLAPAVMRTVQEFARRLELSECSAFTIFGDQPVSVFAEGGVCIVMSHEGRGLLPGMRERIGEIAKALDALYDGGSNSDPCTSNAKS